MSNQLPDQVQRARERVQAWRADPVLFARQCFGIEPDAWQSQAMAVLGGGPNPARRLAMKACTGPGKSATLAWMGWHRLACFAGRGEHPKGAALSITADNLKDNLWAELAKWQARSPFLMEAFQWTKERIYAKEHSETWFLSARSFAKDADAEAIGRSLSGLHSQFPFVLLDETGDMPVAVGKAAEQIFTGAPRDAAIIQAGNPTSMGGLLYQACAGDASRWHVVTVTADPNDPGRTPRVSVEHAQSMIDAYGRDNPWVMATILGLFPPTGFNSLFGADDVDAAMARAYRPEQLGDAPVILGGDVARQGDDMSVVVKRQGRQAFNFRTMRIPDTTLVADQFILEKSKHDPDAFFIDGTGGYGAGVIDAMRRMGHDVIEVQFAASASSPRFFNKRSQMYWDLAEWVRLGGALPPDKELKEELCATTYVHLGDKLRVVEKALIKDQLGRSPDKADALAVTFAHPVGPRNPYRELLGARAGRRMPDHDPYAALR